MNADTHTPLFDENTGLHVSPHAGHNPLNAVATCIHCRAAGWVTDEDLRAVAVAHRTNTLPYWTDVAQTTTRLARAWHVEANRLARLIDGYQHDMVQMSEEASSAEKRTQETIAKWNQAVHDADTLRLQLRRAQDDISHYSSTADTYREQVDDLRAGQDAIRALLYKHGVQATGKGLLADIEAALTAAAAAAKITRPVSIEERTA